MRKEIKKINNLYCKTCNEGFGQTGWEDDKHNFSGVFLKAHKGHKVTKLSN